MRSLSESSSCLNGTDWVTTYRVGEGSKPLNLVTRWGSNSSNHQTFLSWLIKLAQQWGELPYNCSGSSALVGWFDWKSTLEVTLHHLSWVNVGTLTFSKHELYSFLIIMGLIYLFQVMDWFPDILLWNFLTHFWNLLLSKSLEGIHAPRGQISPDWGRSLHGASPFQWAGLLPPTEHRGSFFLLPGVRRETVCLLKTKKSKLLLFPVLYPCVWPGCLGFTFSHSCILNICKQSCKDFSII